MFVIFIYIAVVSAGTGCTPAVLIFIMPPSIQELERRLRGRGDTPEDQIRMRMERATWEMEQRSWYDYVVINDDAQRCADEILAILDNLN